MLSHRRSISRYAGRELSTDYLERIERMTLTCGESQSVPRTR